MQLAKQGFTPSPAQRKSLEVLDFDLHASSRLYVRGYISDSTIERIRKRLVKEVGKIVSEKKTPLAPFTPEGGNVGSLLPESWPFPVGNKPTQP